MGCRAVLVITGKSGVLHSAVPRWLDEGDNRGRILAIRRAQAHHGGEGALYLHAAARAMTPFGVKLRQLRAERGIALKDMAEALGVSAAYLSALEHGRRGRPTHAMVVAICAQLNIIWDEADELMRLARLSHPRVTVDTAGLSPAATELANLLAERIRNLPPDRTARILDIIKSVPASPPRSGGRGRRKERPIYRRHTRESGYPFRCSMDPRFRGGDDQRSERRAITLLDRARDLPSRCRPTYRRHRRARNACRSGRCRSPGLRRHIGIPTNCRRGPESRSRRCRASR